MSDLQFSDDSLRRLVQLIPSMVWIICPDGFADFLNDRWYEHTGLTEDQSLGMGWLEAVHPDDRQRLIDSIDPDLTLDCLVEIEVRYRMADGNYRWHLVRAKRVDSRALANQWFGTSIDIDAKHTAEEISEAQTRAIVETAVDGIITIDSKGIMQSFNAAAERIFGYSAAEVIGENVNILMPEPDRSRHDQYLSNYLQTGTKKIIGIGREVVGKRKDGSKFPMDLAVSELQLSDRRMFTGMVRDVSEKRRAESIIRESQRKLSTLINNLPGAAYRCQNTREWKMEFISDGCLTLSGYSSEQIVASSPAWTDLMQGDRLVQWDQVQAAIADRVPFQMNYRIRHRGGGERWIWEQGRGVYDEHGDAVAIEGLMIDITEQKKAERLAAMGQMMSGIAHESRNALQRIQAAADMLQLELDGNNELQEDLRRIMRAREDLNHLFEELRGFAAPIHTEPRMTSVAESWRKSWEHLEEERRPRDVEIQEHLDDTDLVCCIDPFRMEQVFRNLIENSLAACEDPTRVDITCSAATLNDDPAVCVEFVDNGPGLSEEQCRRVFEAFYTTKTKGTGLGMAIAQRIVEAHGGTIRAIPNDGGAKFRITLPR